MADQQIVVPQGTQNQEVNITDTLQPWETTLRGPEGGDLQDTLFGGWESAKDDPDADGDSASEDDEGLEVEVEDEEEETDPNEGDEEDSEDDQDEESEDEGDDEDSESEALYKVVLPGGEEAEVTLEELSKGYSRQSDYTRKTQEVAGVRKEAEQQREHYLTGLKELEAIVGSFRPQEPDWATLREKNPAEYAALREDFKQYEGRLAAVRGRVQEVEGEAQQEYQHKLQEYAQAERERLLQAYPEWRDPSVQETKRQELWNFAQSAYGFSADELQNVLDHRVVRLLNDAHQGKTVEGKAKEIVKAGAKGKAGKAVLKPGAAKGRKPQTTASKVVKQRTEAASRWQKSGRAQDALSLFETFVD